MKNESLCIPARSVLGFLNNGLVLPRIQLRRRQWQPTPVLLPGKSHGQRSLVGFSPWGCEESDTTERLHFHFSLSCIGEGNGNLLQCSCLENPGDGGAWWAAVDGIAQSRTRLKWLAAAATFHGLLWCSVVPKHKINSTWTLICVFKSKTSIQNVLNRLAEVHGLQKRN